MRDLEVEIKEERPQAGTCPMCGDPAKKEIKVGETQYMYGDWYLVCESKHCEDLSMDDYLESIRYHISHAKEINQTEKYEYERENS